MKNILLAIVCICSSMITRSQSWNWAIGSAGSNNTVEATLVAVDPSGNIYSGGTFVCESGAVTFGPITLPESNAYLRIFLVKADPTGNFQWVVTVDSSSGRLTAITTDSIGNLYVLGIYDSAICVIGSHTLHNPSVYPMNFLAKYSPAGNALWAENIAAGIDPSGGVSYPSGGVATDMWGNVYVTTTFRTDTAIVGSFALINKGPTTGTADIILAKYNTDGNNIWAKNFGGQSDDYSAVLSVAKGGDLYLSGQYTSATMNVGSDTLTDSFFAAGAPYPYQYSFLARFDSSGAPRWAFDMRKHVSVFGITTDARENLIAVGLADSNFIIGSDTMNAIGPKNALLIKYDSSGEMLWANSASPGTAACVSADTCGNVWIAGMCYPWGAMLFDGHSVFEPSILTDPMFIAEYDACGKYVDGSASIYISGGDDLMGMQLDGKGNLIIAGDYEETPIYFGADTLALDTMVGEALFIAKYTYAPLTVPCMLCTPPEQIVASPKTETITVFPNPVSEQLTIEASIIIRQIAITNLFGQTVYSRQHNSDRVAIDVADLPTGIYFVKVNGSYVQNFVKQ